MLSAGDYDLAANPAPGFKLKPEHKVRCELFRGEVVVSLDGAEVARSTSAVLVNETNHSPVYYIPSSDVNSDLLVDSSHVTRCPFKGKARYWNVHVDEHEIDNAVWSYEMPYDEVLELAGLMAFYVSKVKIEATPSN